MIALVDRIEEYVKEHGQATEEELIEKLQWPRPFIREALRVLAPADPESKKPSHRAGSLVVDAEGVWRPGEPPAPPPPEPEKCRMTADGAHIPAINPLYLGSCVACSRAIGPADPVREGYERP
jgi:hypothetical protein